MAKQVLGELGADISWITPFPLLVTPKRISDSYHRITSNFGVQLSHIHTHWLWEHYSLLIQIPLLLDWWFLASFIRAVHPPQVVQC